MIKLYNFILVGGSWSDTRGVGYTLGSVVQSELDLVKRYPNQFRYYGERPPQEEIPTQSEEEPQVPQTIE